LLQLLLALAESPGRVVSHDELTRRVWSDAPPAVGTLHQSVSALRKILGGDFVENVLKRGYRLVLPSEAAGGGRAAARRPRPSGLACQGVAAGACLLAAFAFVRRGSREPRSSALAVLPLSSASDPGLGARLAEALSLRLADARGVTLRPAPGPAG